MRTNSLLALGCAATMVITSPVALAADVVIGVPNWPSVQATAHILKIAMEDKLGLEVELQNGSNTAVFNAMDAGSIHVHPETWMPNLNHLKRQYVDGTKTIVMNANGATGTQQMCVTKDTAERTGIKNLPELKDPEMAKQFDTDGDGKGNVWIGAKGWGSTPIERIRARSYGYDATMNLDIMNEDAALEAVASAIEKKENIVFFCYTPHYMFALHDLVALEEPAYDASKWIIVPPSPTPGWLEKSSAGVAWDEATLHVSYAASLQTTQPEAAAVLTKVSLSTETLSAMTYALAVEKQDPATFAASWIEEHADAVDSWFE